MISGMQQNELKKKKKKKKKKTGLPVVQVFPGRRLSRGRCRVDELSSVNVSERRWFHFTVNKVNTSCLVTSKHFGDKTFLHADDFKKMHI